MAAAAPANASAEVKKLSAPSPLEPLYIRVEQNREAENRSVQKLMNHPRKGLVEMQDEVVDCKEGICFTTEGKLGSGNFGTVFRVRDSRTGFEMADKRLSLTEEVAEQYLQEVNLFMPADSPNIVKYFGFDHFEDQVHIYMELMKTSFHEVLESVKKMPDNKRIPEFILQKLASSVAHALNYLKKEMDLLHRDVKPSNILLGFRGEIKLCDFGISDKLINSFVATPGGNKFYMAPEGYNTNKVDVRSDIWSLGVTLVELARGEYPFPCVNEHATQSAIVNDEPPTLNQADGFSPNFVHFVGLCLRKNVDERPKYTIPPLVATEGSCPLLEHPFVVEVAVTDDRVREWYDNVQKTINPSSSVAS